MSRRRSFLVRKGRLQRYEEEDEQNEARWAKSRKKARELRVSALKQSRGKRSQMQTMWRTRRQYGEKGWQLMTELEKEGIKKGSGGLYCFTPYGSLDEAGKGVFKIGQTTNFHNRLNQYHTYFPRGLYMIAFIVDPPFNAVRKKVWREEKGRTKKELKRQMSAYYRKMEDFLFAKVREKESLGSVRLIRSTVRIRRGLDAREGGETEWVYTSVGELHDLFSIVCEAFRRESDGERGELKLRNMNHVNDRFLSERGNGPHFEGKILFRTAGWNMYTDEEQEEDNNAENVGE